jgi:hypothetical protein
VTRRLPARWAHSSKNSLEIAEVEHRPRPGALAGRVRQASSLEGLHRTRRPRHGHAEAGLPPPLSGRVGRQGKPHHLRRLGVARARRARSPVRTSVGLGAPRSFPAGPAVPERLRPSAAHRYPLVACLHGAGVPLPWALRNLFQLDDIPALCRICDEAEIERPQQVWGSESFRTSSGAGMPPWAGYGRNCVPSQEAPTEPPTHLLTPASASVLASSEWARPRGLGASSIRSKPARDLPGTA